MGSLQVGGAKDPIWPDYRVEVTTLSLILLASFALVLRIAHVYLPLQRTPVGVLVPVVLSLWLPIGVVLLVPIDLASTTSPGPPLAVLFWPKNTVVTGNDNESPTPHAIRFPAWLLLVLWRLLWWCTFLLTWIILPFLTHYFGSGYSIARDRLLYAGREASRDKAVFLGLGAAGLAYVFIVYGVSPESVQTVLVAVPYSWLLAQAIFFLGHGLVALPLAVARKACGREKRLRLVREAAPTVFARAAHAVGELSAVKGLVAGLRVGQEDGTGNEDHGQENLRLWVDHLQQRCFPSNVDDDDDGETARAKTGPTARPKPLHRPAALRLSPAMRARIGALVSPRTVRSKPFVTKDYLAHLERRLQRAQRAKVWRVALWHQLVQDATHLEGEMEHHLPTKPFDLSLTLTRVLGPLMHGLLAAVLALASACVVWSEVIKAFHPLWSVVRLTVISYWWAGADVGVSVSIGGQLVAAAWLLYMYAAVLSSATDLGHWRYALVPGATGHASALWYACQIVKVVVPLSYNFVTFLSPRIYKNTTFYDFIGRLVDLTPLGRWFNRYFPVFILVPAFAALVGLYAKVVRNLGFGHRLDMGGVDKDEADDDDDISHAGVEPEQHDQLWRQGRALIASHGQDFF